jgi:hypothetical protein
MRWCDWDITDQTELFADFHDLVEWHAIVEPSAMITIEGPDQLPQ